jgi:hypothetical protein
MGKNGPNKRFASRGSSMWTEIDRHADPNFEYMNRVWLSASNAVQFRFIRLTQTYQNHVRRDIVGVLCLYEAEFFGTLSE